jgi:hypothetical protein
MTTVAGEFSADIPHKSSHFWGITYREDVRRNSARRTIVLGGDRAGITIYVKMYTQRRFEKKFGNQIGYQLHRK